MANFSATQSFTVQGLCQSITSTDTSDYLNNIEGVTENDIMLRRWTFRDSSGNIIKFLETDKNTKSCSCPISLLTLNISVDLLIIINNKGGFGVQNNFMIACLLT